MRVDSSGGSAGGGRIATPRRGIDFRVGLCGECSRFFRKGGELRNKFYFNIFIGVGLWLVGREYG